MNTWRPKEIYKAVEGERSNREESISRDFEQKPVRHTFDRKAFRRNSVSLLLWPFIMFLFQLLLLTFDSEEDLLDIAVKAGIQTLTFLIAFISFLTMLHTQRSSDVFTAPGCVLYRKRRFFTSQLDGVRYIVYHITNVKSVKGDKKHPAVVKGNINAVYVLDDGKTISSYKACRKVSIPPCFTDMETIRETLEAMETGSVKTEKGYLAF